MKTARVTDRISGEVVAEVTRDAVERLNVTVGRELFALVKSVSLEF